MYSVPLSLPSPRAVHALGLGLGALAQARGLRLGLAESCTGGLASAWITAIPGSSGWFEGGVVSYSNALKMALLQVPVAALSQHGAVSLPVAEAMARGLCAAFSEAHLVAPSASPASPAQPPGGWATVSITGIAGPGGGSEDKPVGMVCFAWLLPEGRLSLQVCRFSGNREAIQRQAAWWALAGLFSRLSAGPIRIV